MDLLEKVKKTDLSDYEKCKKVVLAYSGGLDTSVLLKLLQNIGIEVITLTLDMGQGEYPQQALQGAKKKAETLGAKKAFIFDAKEEFVQDYVNKAIQANCLYQGNYPCSTALGRPLIAKHLVQVAEKEGADAVVHGSTGKGNDYLRFHVSVKALSPHLEVLAPVRDWQFTREEEIEYAKSEGIPVPVTKEKPYSVDANLWGRSSEGGVIENEDEPVPENALQWVNAPEKSLDNPGLVELFFNEGIPVKAEFNGRLYKNEVEMIHDLNAFAGKQGVGIIDQIEDRTIGLKSREYYECPAALTILRAHKDLELLCLSKEVNSLKPFMEQKFAEYSYSALWYSPAMHAVNAFINETQKNVEGWVLMKLYKGSVSAIARSSSKGLYSKKLATYGKSSFNQLDSKGFANLYSLSTINSTQAGKAKEGSQLELDD